MGKPTICIGENKGTDQLRSNCEADQRLCFRYTDSTISPPKFQASSHLLCLYRSVCVGPGRKPHFWFSHEAAQLFNSRTFYYPYIDSLFVVFVFSSFIYNHFKINS